MTAKKTAVRKSPRGAKANGFLSLEHFEDHSVHVIVKQLDNQTLSHMISSLVEDYPMMSQSIMIGVIDALLQKQPMKELLRGACMSDEGAKSLEDYLKNRDKKKPVKSKKK